VTVSPLFTEPGEAFSVTVGCAAGCGAACVGGVAATCFLQPPTKAANATRPNNNANFLKLPSCIDGLLRRSEEGLPETPPYLFIMLAALPGPDYEILRNCLPAH
jgi:hypothetical protein